VKDQGRNLALFLLRLMGLFMACKHGWGKLVGLSSGTSGFINGVAEMGFPFPVAFAWAAALTEFVGALLVTIGLFTRLAAAVNVFNMAVAAFLGHKLLQQIMVWTGLLTRSDEVVKGWGNPEMAVLYLVIFAAVALLGPGAWSLDARFRKVK
jgi:putative oxidoreductase